MKNIRGNLNKDLDTCRKILYLFHPEVPHIDDERLQKLCRNGNYDWVEIEGRIKDYGSISLLISNRNDPTGLYGGRHPLSTFEQRQPKLQFYIWRSSLDKFPTNDLTGWDDEIRDFTNSESYKLREQYTAILKEAGYRTQTAKEWMKYYYSD